MAKFFYVLTIINGFLATLVGIIAFAASNSAVQEAAIAASMCAAVAVPYCVGRASDGFSNHGRVAEILTELRALRKAMSPPTPVSVETEGAVQPD